MRDCYLDRESRGIVDLVYEPERDRWWITRVNVPVQVRRGGHGGRLMRRVLTEADEEGVTLCLEVQPSGGMPLRPLREWYRRLGFVGTRTMVRTPRGSAVEEQARQQQERGASRE